MIKKRSARIALLACAGVASLGLVVGPATATAKVKKKVVTKTATVNQCVSTSSAITDPQDQSFPASAVIPVTSVPLFRGVEQPGVITSFASAGVRITHTYNADLIVWLISPGGKIVQLANLRDIEGDGFGTGSPNCSGALALFGDAFPTPIADQDNTGDTPISGSFKPEQPLSQVVGGPARGPWSLFALDTDDADEGTLDAFSVNYTYSYKALKKVKKKKKKK